MLEWWQALILGSVQGVTEFLPVSSTGHLIFAESLLKTHELGLRFDIFVHLGTLAAVLLFFRHRLVFLLRDYWLQLVAATIPAMIFGVLFQEWIESIRTDMSIMALSYVFNGLLLAIASLLLPPEESPVTRWGQVRQSLGIQVKRVLGIPMRSEVSLLPAFLIGVFQALAIIPGVSRSASSVSAGLLVGLSRETAFTFAFLMSVPAVLGALVFDLTGGIQPAQVVQIPWHIYLIAVTASAITGWFSLLLLRWVIHRGQLSIFAGYCFLVSILIVFFA